MATRNDRNRLVRLELFAFTMSLVVAIPRPAIAQAKPDAARQQRIEKLIQSLASPNKDPGYVGDKDDYPRVKIPAGYDRAAQSKVLEAWRLLLDEGIDAFPALVSGMKDNRYSCTVADTPGDGEFNLTVGQVCRDILRNNVNAITCSIENSYGPNVIWWRAARKSHFDDDVPKWWQERRNRSLPDLQIETAQYAIDILKTDKATPIKPDQDIKELETLIAQVKVSGRPIEPTGIENRYRRMIGLPGKDEIWLGPHPYKSKKKAANNE